jgi:hypothetical protein
MTREQFNSICNDFFNIISNIQEKDGNEIGYSRSDILDAFLNFYDKAQEVFDNEEEFVYNTSSNEYKFGIEYTTNLMKNKDAI